MQSVMATKNLDLAFEVIYQVLNEPALADEVVALADGGALVLYDDTDQELTEHNDRMAAIFAARGDNVTRAALERRLTFNPR